jgi:transcriptional regulator with XRE-family HTH domain
MYSILFQYTLRKRRKALGYTQKDAAANIGMPRRRWNGIETGRYRPTSQELQKMRLLLGECNGFIRPARASLVLLQEGRNFVKTPQPFYPPQDRASNIRYREARRRFPDLVSRLTVEITRRKDFTSCEYLSHKLALGSYAEAVFALHLQAAGAVPGLVAPARIYPTPHAIVDPTDMTPVAHRPMPCLALGSALYFFQASLAASRLFTVDCLKWDDSWSVIEIDGEGHDFTNDSERTAALGLPVIRISAVELSAPNFVIP